jgi:hypothetical protein
MATLEEKQAYFQYGESGWTYKQPPRLDPSLVKEMERFGADEYGDPLYRFLWGGVAVVRQEEDGVPYVRGDRAATKINNGRLQPRYLFARAKQPTVLCYRNRKGKVVPVKRKSQVPKHYVAFWQVQYVDFGQLFWYLERKLTPTQLVEANYYLPNDPKIPARGDYVCIHRVEAPGGIYFEPTEEYLSAVREYLREENNESLNDLMLRDRQGREEAQAAQRDAEEASRVRLVETLMAHNLGKPVHELFQR